MSRQNIPMGDGSLLVIGYDPPFKTWFAIHYDDRDEHAPPRLAIGYHPDEQAILRAERPDAIIGPYPIGDDRLEEMLHTMLPELGGELFAAPPKAEQPMCWYCGRPPWGPSPDCGPRHPYERLRHD